MTFPGDLRQSLGFVWRASPRIAATVLAALILQSAFSPLLLLALRRVINQVVCAGQTPVALEVSVGLVAAVAIGEALIRAFATLMGDHQADTVANRVRAAIAARSSGVGLATIENPAFHGLFQAAREDGPVFTLQLSRAFNQLLRASLTLAGLTVLLLSAHWLLVVLLVVGAAPLALTRAWQENRLRGSQDRVRMLERRAASLWDMLTRLEFAKEVRAFHMGPSSARAHGELQLAAGRERLNMGVLRARAEIITQVAAELAILGGLYLLASRALAGRASIGALVISFWALQFCRSLLSESLSAVAAIHQATLRLAPLRALLALPDGPPEPAMPVLLPARLTHGFEFRGVSLTYGGAATPALRDVDLVIAPGERIALVGANGSGKSSFVKLLCRLYDPTTGVILFNGAPLTASDSPSLRGRMAIVFQDFGRFEMTAGENISVCDPRLAPGDPAIAAAARAAGIDDRLAKLPQGYDTPLGRRLNGGADLSVGEWQKIALARAFVRDAEIVVFDEPTSALDAAAEQSLIEHLWTETAGKTVVIVSHRLSTVRHADRIVVLREGQIVEVGPHDTLMAAGGVYADLFSRQAEPYR